MAAAIPYVVGTGIGLLGASALKRKDKDEETRVTSTVTPPKVPTTEERAKGITDAAREEELRKKMRKGFRSTILTSPLGVEKEARTNLKTLLGE